MEGSFTEEESCLMKVEKLPHGLLKISFMEVGKLSLGSRKAV
jgi:hypothetical protein